MSWRHYSIGTATERMGGVWGVHQLLVAASGLPDGLAVGRRRWRKQRAAGFEINHETGLARDRRVVSSPFDSLASHVHDPQIIPADPWALPNKAAAVKSG